MDAKSIRRAKLAELKAIRENGGKRVYTVCPSLLLKKARQTDFDSGGW